MHSYIRVLRAPGLRVPLIATVVGALPLGMLGLGLLLYVNELTGSLTDAGMTAGAFGAGNALGLPLQGRLIDRFGQTAVVAPAGAACGAWTILLVTTAPTVDSVAFAVAVSAGAGACVPATTGSMRVLLAELLEEGQVRAAGYALLAVLFQLALLTGPLATSALLTPAEPAGAVAAGGILAAAAGLLFCGTKAEEAMSAAPAKIYGHLSATGCALEWTGTVTARSPLPDERSALHISDSAPLLLTYRLTLDAETGRPLMLEELRAGADSAALTFRMTATRPPKAAKQPERDQVRATPDMA